MKIVKGYPIVFKLSRISIVKPNLMFFQNIDTLVQHINLKKKNEHELVLNYFVKSKSGKYHKFVILAQH